MGLCGTERLPFRICRPLVFVLYLLESRLKTAIEYDTSILGATSFEQTLLGAFYVN